MTRYLVFIEKYNREETCIDLPLPLPLPLPLFLLLLQANRIEEERRK
jgi:hypothetical protein